MIRIENDKIVVIDHHFLEKEIDIKDIPFYLSDNIEIVEGVKFERIFDIIIDNKELFNISFSHSMGGHTIDMFIDDYNKKLVKDEENNVEYCEIYRVFEHNIYTNGEEDNELYFGFHGVGKESEETITTYYSFMYSSISTFKSYPIKIDNKLEIRIDTGKNLGDDNVEFKDKYKLVHTAILPITVFQFIDAILHEISWMGTPKRRDEEANKLEELSRKIDSDEEKEKL